MKMNLHTFNSYIKMINFDKIFYFSDGTNIPFEEIFPIGSYSVVGNSPIILERKQGFKIDSSDYVIRFNNYKIEEFESYIGRRTSMWITSGTSYLKNKHGNNIFIIPKFKSFTQKKKILYDKYNTDNFFIFHNNYLLNIIYELLQGPPTIGMIILLLLSHKYININSFGFSFGKYNDKYHYYDENVKIYYSYSLKKEKEIYLIMLRNKLIDKEFNIIKKIEGII